MTIQALDTCGFDINCLFAYLASYLLTLVTQNLPDVLKSTFVFGFEMIAYIPATIINQVYTFFSNVYSILYGAISFYKGIFAVVELIRSGYWSDAMPTVITYIFFLSIGIANSRLIYRIALRIYRLIPLVGGR